MTARTQRAKRPRKFRCRVVAAGMLLGAFTVMSAPLLAQTPQATLNRHLEQAQVHLDARNYRLVVEELRQAIAIHPGIPGANYQLGPALWHLHDMEESRIAFLKELEFDPPDAYSLYYLGRIEVSDGDTVLQFTLFG